MQNFVPTNIIYLHYKTLEFVDPLPFSQAKIAENVPANNCHLKVRFYCGCYIKQQTLDCFKISSMLLCCRMSVIALAGPTPICKCRLVSMCT